MPRRAALLIHKRVRRHVDLDELIALGNAGLAEAARRFDEHRHASFKTYGWYRVHGAILDGIRRLAPISRRTWRRLVALRRERSQQPHSDVIEAIDAQITAVSRRYTVPLEETATACAAAPSAADLAERIDRARWSSLARAAMIRLPPVQRELLHKHYWQGKDLLTVGAELKRSKSWASRNHADAIDRLRCDMGELLEAP